MNTPLPEPLSVPEPLSDQEMTQLRDRVVSSLAATASSSTGTMQRTLNRLADFLAYGDVPQCVLKHTVLLEIFVSLRDIPSPTQIQIDGIVEQTISRTYARTRTNQPWWMVLFYPIVAMFVCGIVIAGICWLIVPTFETMFNEFGLVLPAPTIGLIALSHAIVNPLLYMILACISIAMVGLFWFISGNEGKWSRTGVNDPGPRFRRDWFPSKRVTWADWAWHLSLLLRFGKQDADAIAIAGSASGKRWLRHGSEVWADAIRSGNQPFKDVTHFRGEACHLMSWALNSDGPQDQRAEMLAYVSEVYWDRDQTRTRWQLSWISPFLIFLIGTIVWFVMMALFMPMVALISGLS